MEQQGSSSAAPPQTGEASSVIRMRKSAWSAEEDALLRAAVNQHGPQNWEHISAAVPGRNAKSCRLRWRQHLDHTVVASTPFTAEEDALVVRYQRLYPNKWATIAGFLHGRTDNAVMNRWNSVLRKQQQQQQHHQQQQSAAAAEDHQPFPRRHDRRMLELFPLKRGDVIRMRGRRGPVLEYVAPPADGDVVGEGQNGGACLELFFPLRPGDLVGRSSNAGADADAAPMDVDAGAGDPLTELKLGQSTTMAALEFNAMVQAVRAP